MKTRLLRFIPRFLRSTQPTVHVVRLHGAIGMGTPLRPALTLQATSQTLERAFSKKGIQAVAISLNSPGGSPVQSALIYSRIRALAEKHKLPVYVFCEDVAASGGYWLACAGDEIYADPSSIVGSIGVIAASFGFVDAMDKLGIERRVHTSGENKSILDPFLPEKPEDVDRLKTLQSDVHEAFKALVRERRSGKLVEQDGELFSGAFWSGKKALALGLIDGLGHLHEVLKQKYGEKVEIKVIEKPQGWGLKRLGFGIDSDFTASAIEALETRAIWARFGL
jgi:signal peptide peptidase SppA